MKLRKWAWLMWAYQNKKEKKIKGKGEWIKPLGLDKNNNTTNSD